MNVKDLKQKLKYVVYEYDQNHDLRSTTVFEDVSLAKDYIVFLVTECPVDFRHLVIHCVHFCYS